MKFVVLEKPNKWSLGTQNLICFTIQNNRIATFNHMSSIENYAPSFQYFCTAIIIIKY